MFKKSNIKEKLTKMSREAEERDAQRRAQKNNLPYFDAATSPVDIQALSLISEDAAKEAKIAAIEVKENKLALVTYDPSIESAQKLINELKSKGFQLKIFIVSLNGLNYVFSFYKFISKVQEKITSSVKVDSSREKIVGLDNVKKILESINSLNKGTAAAEILEIVFDGALINRASDIHFEPDENKIKIRMRVDGILHDVFYGFNKNFYFNILSRLKLLSNLKINISDESQDGRFTMDFAQKKVEVRIAIAPSEFGEVVVMRLLDPDAINISLINLGIREDDLKIIETELKRPNGLILNTGPTGSGKTTTLYAFLKYKKSSEIKIITIEDPIEYHLEGIEQTQVDEESGYTFADGLRSLMRQDPDMILVGEIRDKETAEIGIQAALTGHLVLSTIHANSAAGAIPRIIDLGVKPSSIGPALNLIIAQRLVRKLCEDCKLPQETDKVFQEKIEKFLEKLPKKINKEKYREIKIFSPKGCLKCNNSGYKGRIGIYELLLNDPEYEKLLIDPTHTALSSHKELEELIMSSASESAIKKFALEQEMTTMQQDGILKVISGITTLEEVEAVTGPSAIK